MSTRTLLIHSLLVLSLLTWLIGGAQAQNTLLGTGAGASLTGGYNNTLLGYNAGNAITGGTLNTLVGHGAGQNTTSGANAMLGYEAGRDTTTGSYNAFFGSFAGLNTTTGSYNTYVGTGAGEGNSTGTYNVFVGYYAGINEVGSDKLYIANSSTSMPLIYGDFASDLVGINGALGVGTQMPMDQLHVRDGNLRIEQTGATHAVLNFIANGHTWEIKTNQATGRLTFFSPGGGATTASFKFDRQAVENLLRVGVLAADTVDINGNLMVTGTFTNPDYVFTPEYNLESIEAHAAYMWEHRHLPAVGPGQVNAQGQGMVNVGQRSQGMLEELEKAHIYIEQLNNKMAEKETQLKTMRGESAHKEEQIAALSNEVTANEARVAALQAKVTALQQKEAQIETLQGEVADLKVLIHQLMSQNPGTTPGKEG